MSECKVWDPQAIVEIILSNPNEITLLPIDPLTNIAMVYLVDPKISWLVKYMDILGCGGIKLDWIESL